MLEKLGVSKVLSFIYEIENIIDISYMHEINMEELHIKFEFRCNCEKTLVLENVRVEGDFDFAWDMEDYWEISECDEGHACYWHCLDKCKKELT